MSDDIIRSKGYAIYKYILRKALLFLMNAIVNSVITDYKVWDATLVLTMRVSDKQITKRTAKITVKEKQAIIEGDETTVIDKTDLNFLMDSGQFDTVIHTIQELDSKQRRRKGDGNND